MTDSPAHSSSSNGIAAYLDAELDSDSSDVSPEQEAEDESDSEYKRVKRQKVEEFESIGEHPVKPYWQKLCMPTIKPQSDRRLSLSRDISAMLLMTLSKTEKKIVYNQNLCQLLGEFDQILIIATADVGHNRLLDIRKVLRGDSVFPMGKSTVMNLSGNNMVVQNNSPSAARSSLHEVPVS